MSCILTQHTPGPVAKRILARWPALVKLHISADWAEDAARKLGRKPLPPSITSLGFNIKHDWEEGQQLLDSVGASVGTLTLGGVQRVDADDFWWSDDEEQERESAYGPPDLANLAIPAHLHTLILVKCEVRLIQHKLPPTLQHLELLDCHCPSTVKGAFLDAAAGGCAASSCAAARLTCR
jgi:hypothetical protein